jgi:hypothetical protein
MDTGVTRQTAGQVRGLPPALRAERLASIALDVALLLIAPGPLAAQDGPREGNPFDRWQYFYRQRAYPFAKIPPHALQAARGRYEARSPTAVRAQGAEAVSSTTGWAPLGPSAISDFYKSAGRMTAIAIDPTSSNTIYIGAADGGVWKTTDGGGSRVPLTDSQCSLAMGALAIDPVTPTIVYAGTGELNFTADNYGGCGVLRSTDGGNDRQATRCWGLNCTAATS